MATLSVSLNEVRVGWLEALDDYNYCFDFDPEWLADPERPILGQLFEDQRPTRMETSGMPCWFYHLLPQGPLRRLVARAAGVDSTEDFDVLVACGADLPGAVILTQTETRFARPTTHVNIDSGPGMRLGFALAGNQWKLSVRQGERGLVIPAKDESAEWIAKFSDAEFPRLTAVEHATTMLARHCGIPTPETQLVPATAFERLPDGLPIGDGVVFLSRRFDRLPDRRVHMEDFAQVLDRPDMFAGNYEEIAGTLQYVCPESVDDFIRQLVFCITIGNGDAHLKNWSLLYSQPRSPRLSPAYDLIPTVVYRRHEDLALTLGGTRSFKELSSSRFVKMAMAIGRAPESLQSQVHELFEHFIDSCRTHLNDVGFDQRERQLLAAHLDLVDRQFNSPA